MKTVYRATLARTKLEFRFVEHRNDADLYEVSLQDDTIPESAPIVKLVEFKGEPIVVFEDATRRFDMQRFEEPAS